MRCRLDLEGGRGFGGKSTLMGTLCAIEAAALGAQITVLGGSASQSECMT